MNNNKAKFAVFLAGAAFLVAVFLFSGCSENKTNNIEVVQENTQNQEEHGVKRENEELKSKVEEPKELDVSEEETEMSEEDLQRYYASYSDPYVLHVRKALNGYLNGTNEGMDIPEVVIEKDELGGSPSGLATFDKSYYESKFVVVYITDALFGGKNIAILFQDKPDKVFVAWVYKLAGDQDDYDMRGFWEDQEMTENIDEMIETMGDLVFDKEYCL